MDRGAPGNNISVVNVVLGYPLSAGKDHGSQRGALGA
jgi:hypothetical protein